MTSEHAVGRRRVIVSRVGVLLEVLAMLLLGVLF